MHAAGRRFDVGAMDGSDAEVLERCREQAGSFENMQDRSDERLNDGNNYKGLMSRDAYVKKREEVLEDPTAKQKERIMSAVHQDREARDKDAQERAERERLRKERLQRELAGDGDGDGDGDGEAADDGPLAAPPSKKQKKKKKAAAGGALSFDAEEDG